MNVNKNAINCFDEATVFPKPSPLYWACTVGYKLNRKGNKKVPDMYYNSTRLNLSSCVSLFFLFLSFFIFFFFFCRIADSDSDCDGCSEW